MSMASVGWWIAASLLLVPVWAQEDPSADRMRALGESAHQEMVKRSKALDNADVQAYVAGIGDRLVRQLGTTRVPYRFDVLVTAEANEPVAFHNGGVVVPAAFLARVADEKELARHIAHGMAHTEMPTPLLGTPGRIVLWFPHCHMDCDINDKVPTGMRPKWQAMEEEATRLGDALVARTPLPADADAFRAMQQAVREALNMRTPAERKPPSLYRRVTQ